ncbi:MAG: hypothetical protein BGO29_14785 [Bacteroidales bacterium 36-12]|nr:MAG: hypothetical protein BGO29_14785 [Bacteroidales bacterium 36-12]
MINRLRVLQANKGQFANGRELSSACKTNKDLRHEIEVLSKHILNKNVSGCQNCYMDAYIELVNLNINKVMEKQKCDFRLRAGVLLRDVVSRDPKKNCSNANITNELALYHLKTNPECRKYFDKIPDDFNEQLKSYLLPAEKEIKVKQAEVEEKAKLAVEAAKKVQAEAEEKAVAQVAAMLKAGETKTVIKDKFKEIEKVGEKNTTVKFISELIARAEKLNMAN